MRMKSREWVQMIMILLIALSLIGCNNISSTNDTFLVNKGDDGSKLEKPYITLRYSSYLLDTAQAGKAYFDAIKEFEVQNPGVKIEADFIQNANYTAGIKIRLLGGVRMDIFDTWSPSLFEEFRALGDHMYLDLTGSEFLNEFLPTSLKPVTIDGKVYGAPEVMHSDGLLYNKTMFEQLGLTVPQTWTEFIDVCERLKRVGIIPVAMDAEWSTAQFFWGSMMSNNGADGEWTKKLENGKVKISDPIFVDAIKKHKEIIDRGYVPKDWMSIKHEQAKDLVGQGKSAMIITGTWDIPSIMERNSAYDIDFMMVPGEKRTVPNINVGTYRVINAKTEYPEEAKRFVAFMNSKANQQKLAVGALAVPSIMDFQIANPVVAKIAAVVTRADATLYWPHTVSRESLQVKIQEAVNRYLAGQSLEETLGEIQKAVDSTRK